MDKTALVTGASRGIGRAIAAELGRKGWSVTVNYRGNAEAAKEALSLVEQAGGQGLLVQADISRSEDRSLLLEKTLARFGRIDLLVNNAGMAPRSRVDMLEMGEASYDEVMAVNLKGPFFLTQLVANRMIALVKAHVIQHPRIVNMGSLSAYTSSVNRAEYCLSKAGVAMMTALYADRLAEYGIHVFELRPGIIQTDMTSVVRDKYTGLIAEGLMPIRRWGQPSDVALAVLAIAEGYLPYSTGEVINVDGGFSLRRL